MTSLILYTTRLSGYQDCIRFSCLMSCRELLSHLKEDVHSIKIKRPLSLKHQDCYSIKFRQTDFSFLLLALSGPLNLRSVVLLQHWGVIFVFFFDNFLPAIFLSSHHYLEILIILCRLSWYSWIVWILSHELVIYFSSSPALFLTFCSLFWKTFLPFRPVTETFTSTTIYLIFMSSLSYNSFFLAT